MTLTHKLNSGLLRIAAAGALAGLLAGALAGCSSAAPASTETTSVARDEALAKLVPETIRNAGKVTVATNDDYPPLMMIGEDGKSIVGAEPELITAIGQVLGLEVELSKVNFDSLISGIQAGRFDIGMQAMLDTAERQKQVTFVDYFNTSTTMLVKAADAKKYPELDTLCGQTVAVESGTGQVAMAQEQSQKCVDAGKAAITVDEYADGVASLQAVVTDRAKAFLGGTPTIVYQAEKSDGALVALGTPMNLKAYGILIPKDQPEFAEGVQGALQKLIDDGTYGDILAKYGVQEGAIEKATINGGN